MSIHINPGNYAAGVLTNPITDSQTTIQIQVTSPGFSFPALAATVDHAQQYYYLTVVDAATQGALQREIMKVTGPSSGGTGTITLTVVRAQEGTAAQAFAALDGAAIRPTRQTYIDFANQGGPLNLFSVTDFGALGDGTTDNTNAVKAAMAAAANSGGGIVTFPPGNFRFTGVFPDAIDNVSWQGAGIGPYRSWNHLFAGPGADQTTISIENTGSPFITTGMNCAFRDLIFFYPNQVTPTTATPIVYPYTIVVGSANVTIERCTIVNAYNAISLAADPNWIRNCLIGAFNIGVLADGVLGPCFMENVNIADWWNLFLGLSFPQTVDTWVSEHSIKCDFGSCGMFISNATLGAADIGIRMRDGSGGGASDVRINNLQANGRTAAVYCQSTVAEGCCITNFFLQPNAAGSTPVVGVSMPTGGSHTPMLTMVNGDIGGFGSGPYSVTSAAGNLSFTNVVGADRLGPTISAPSVPASTVFTTVRYPYPVTVYIIGGTFTDVNIKQTVGGSPVTTSVGASRTVSLPANALIAVTYSGAPTWIWMSPA